MRRQTKDALARCLYMVHKADPDPEVVAPPEIRRDVQRMVVVGRHRDMNRAIIEGIKWGLLIAAILAALFL